MAAEKCEFCGRFGAHKMQSSIKGPSSSSNPQGIVHLWLCWRCTDEQARFEATKQALEMLQPQREKGV